MPALDERLEESMSSVNSFFTAEKKISISLPWSKSKRNSLDWGEKREGTGRHETNIFTGNQRMGKIYINYWNVNKHFAVRSLLFLVKHRFA